MIKPGSGVTDGSEKTGTPEFWRSRRVLVTGGAGFLGSHILGQLEALGAQHVFAPTVADYDLTEIDALQLRMNVSAAENIDGNDRDYRQAGMSVSYSRDINRDWSFVTGYSHSFAEDDTEEVTTVNKVFARLDRRFSLRP